MDHPLRDDNHKSLRKRVVSHIREGYTIQRQSNIVFVCGGNSPETMRRRFQAEFPRLMPDFEFFEPEFAMKSYFSFGDRVPFDIANFEELVGDLAHSIVLFPEAPGSYAETGYFSAIAELAYKTILVVNAANQEADSFISLGPAKRINEVSRFQPNIQLNYEHPDFSIITRRVIDRAPLNRTKQFFNIGKFSETPNFHLFALIQEVVNLLSLATIDDIEFFLRSIYSGHIGPSTIKKILSILVGSDRLLQVSDYGHLKANREKNSFLSLRDGAKTTHDVLKVDISRTFLDAAEEFQALIGGPN